MDSHTSEPVPFRLLLLEDDLSDAELTERQLRKAGLVFDLTRVESLAEFLDGIRSFRPDIIISDYTLPQFTALDALELLKEQGFEIPLILLTGTQVDEKAVKCLKLGAVDYVLKSAQQRLPSAVENALEKQSRERQARQDQQQFEIFMENMPCLAYIKDGGGQYLYTNQKMRDAFAIASEGIADNKTGERVSDELAHRASEDDALVLSTHQSLQSSQVTSFGGKEQYWNTFKFPLPRGAGETIIGGIAMDVTGQALLNNRLIENDERYRLIFKATESALWDYDLIKDTVTWNEAITDYFGYNPDAIERSFQWFLDCIHAEDLDRVREEFQAVIEGVGARWESEFRFRRADGDYLTFASHAYIMRDAGSRATRVIASMSNITQRKEWEEGLIQARNRAVEMSSMKTNFLANMSHEMRTPMTSILGFTELLLEDATGETIDMLNSVRLSSRRLMDTMDSLLDLARLDAELHPVLPEEFNVSEVIQSVVNKFSHAVASKDIAISFINNAPRLNASLDLESFRRILVHLIGNALKFTSFGSITVTLGTTDNQSFHVDVTDTGIGISEETLPSIFDGFKQESEGYARRYEGNGIGLTLAKRLAEGLGGPIAVRSVKDSGSTFSITLPIVREEFVGASEKTPPSVDTTPDQLLDATALVVVPDAIPARSWIHSSAHERSWIGQAPIEARKADGSLRQIMVVEDSDDIVTMVKFFLKNSANVVHASSGAEAVRLAMEGLIDLILMDLNLGVGIDGLEATRQIRTATDFKTKPIIAMTAYAMPTDRSLAKSAGCSDFLAKPFTKRDLLETITKAFAEH